MLVKEWETAPEQAMKNIGEVSRDCLTDDEFKGVILSTLERCWEAPIEKIKIEKTDI